MKDIAVEDVRNFVLLGHTGSGKTMLCDAFLYKLGLTEKQGQVSAGTSLSDFTEEEISRKISLYTQSFTGVFKTKQGQKIQMTFVDTPGFDDFYGQVLCASHVADAALITIDATAGIQVGTNRVWRRCAALGLPRGIVITGLDKENANFAKILADAQKVWGPKCVPVVFPVAGGVVEVLGATAPAGATAPVGVSAADWQAYKSALIERAAETDDALLEKYLGGTELTDDEIAKGLRVAVCAGSLIPVFAVMTPKDIGVNELLGGIVRLFPAPLERTIKDTAGTAINPATEAPFVGVVWRHVTDPYAGKLSYVRIYGGTLKENTEVFNATKGQKEKIGVLLQPQGKKPSPITEARSGDIVALPKLKNTGLNDVLCAVGQKVAFEPVVFPSPVVSVAVLARNQADDDKLGIALTRAVEDDPTLVVERHADTRETVLSGMGDAHLELVHDLMKKRSNLDAEFKVPKVAYKETVTGLGDGHYKHKKQSGGRGQYAEVYCKVQAKRADEAEWFDDAVVGGVIPRNFIPACEKGFLEAIPHGVLAGYPVVNVKVSVYDGSYHDVDSSEIAFKIAAARAFKEALIKAKPVLLEPIMTVRVMVPEQSMGDINGDLNHRRGRILGVDMEDGVQVITAEVPQAEMFRYSSELRSITGGRGSFEIKFARYDVVPNTIAQKVIAGAEKKKEAEE
ncbi:MAG: elongation factor G [Verrucomicrobia bacterium]|nr:elongation factor G [Verrucomicrobiota bacterium]MBU1734106.1 elongation factor G [Verrucomicrobiota bacterium]MBU1856420.1 elongation factor G [Verrucomicrobiota bacterium]